MYHKLYLKNTLVLMTIFILSSKFISAKDTLFIKTGEKIAVDLFKYKSMNKLYFEHQNMLYYIKRDEFSQTLHQDLLSEDSTWKKLSFDEIREETPITESPYISNKKATSLKTSGILLTFVVPSIFGAAALSTGAHELFIASPISLAVGAVKWIKGIKKQNMANEILNAQHYTSRE